MQIATIGAGNVGGALGRGWACAGHAITYGVPDPSEARHRATAEGNQIRSGDRHHALGSSLMAPIHRKNSRAKCAVMGRVQSAAAGKRGT
jgi:predicted dinucleotide-binding enzyme